MPPSAGACQTIEALLKPDCGRAGERSSIMTAITWRSAASGLTRRPVSGAGTSCGGGGTDGGGSVGGAEDGLGATATPDGDGAVEGANDGPGDAVDPAAAPPDSSVATWAATRMPSTAIAMPMSPMSPRRSAGRSGALESATLPPGAPV